MSAHLRALMRVATSARDVMDAHACAGTGAGRGAEPTDGCAKDPQGYHIVDQCPLPEAVIKEDIKNLVNRKILYCHPGDNELQEGWYMGTVHKPDVCKRDLTDAPRANCVVKFRKKDTGRRDCVVACELTASGYGRDKHWVLLQML